MPPITTPRMGFNIAVSFGGKAVRELLLMLDQHIPNVVRYHHRHIEHIDELVALRGYANDATRDQRRGISTVTRSRKHLLIIGQQIADDSPLSFRHMRDVISDSTLRAIKTTVLTNFLDASGVSYTTVGAGQSLQPSDLAERAKSISVLIRCEK